MARIVTKKYTKEEEYSYEEFDSGELVFANPHFYNTQLDYERIYKVDTFTPPLPPGDPQSKGTGSVKLLHRETPVDSVALRSATPEMFQQEYSNDPKKVKYFIEYLDWLKKGDRFQ